MKLVIKGSPTEDIIAIIDFISKTFTPEDLLIASPDGKPIPMETTKFNLYIPDKLRSLFAKITMEDVVEVEKTGSVDDDAVKEHMVAMVRSLSSMAFVLGLQELIRLHLKNQPVFERGGKQKDTKESIADFLKTVK